MHFHRFDSEKVNFFVLHLVLSDNNLIVASIKSFIEIFRKWRNKKQIASKNKENEVVKFGNKIRVIINQS